MQLVLSTPVCNLGDFAEPFSLETLISSLGLLFESLASSSSSSAFLVGEKFLLTASLHAKLNISDQEMTMEEL